MRFFARIQARFRRDFRNRFGDTAPSPLEHHTRRTAALTARVLWAATPIYGPLRSIAKAKKEFRRSKRFGCEAGMERARCRCALALIELSMQLFGLPILAEYLLLELVLGTDLGAAVWRAVEVGFVAQGLAVETELAPDVFDKLVLPLVRNRRVGAALDDFLDTEPRTFAAFVREFREQYRIDVNKRFPAALMSP